MSGQAVGPRRACELPLQSVVRVVDTGLSHRIRCYQRLTDSLSLAPADSTGALN
jgi:hypothetical protein